MSPDVASPSNVASGANAVSGFPGRRSAEREGDSRTESLVTPYAQLRKTLASRDRSLRRKVMSLEEATAFVQDGDTVGIGGSTMSRTPMGMIWALIRARKSRLSCVRSIV